MHGFHTISVALFWLIWDCFYTEYGTCAQFEDKAVFAVNMVLVLK